MKVLLFLFFVLIIIISWYFLQCITLEGFEFPFLMKPHLSNGDKFYLKTRNGEYVSVCFTCHSKGQNLLNKCSANLCLKKEPTATSIFEYLPHRDGTFSIRTFEGKYWKRCEFCFDRCPNIICADGVNGDLQPSKFVLIKNGGDGSGDGSGDGAESISIKTDTGRLLETQECEQTCGKIISAIGVGNNSEFIIEKLPHPYVPPQRVREPTKKFVMPSYAPLIIPFISD